MMGWDIEGEFNPQGSGWADRVHSNIPRIEEDEMVLLRRLEKKLDDMENKPRRGKDRQDDQEWDEGKWLGGNQVTNETEEMGSVGPSEWERERVDK